MTAILRAVSLSTLTANQRLVVAMVAQLGDTRTGAIPDRFRPALGDVARMTGLSRATIYRCPDLRSGFDGWLEWESGALASARIAAAKIPDPSQYETTDDLDLSQNETDLSQDETDLSQIEIPSLLHGPYGPTGLKNSVAPPADESLFQLVTFSPREPTKTDEAFAAFWSAYPRKVGKGHGRTAWAKALKNGADPVELIAAAEKYAARCVEVRTEPQFIPHPATWLNGERWTDQFEALGLVARSGHQPYRNPADPSAYEGDL